MIRVEFDEVAGKPVAVFKEIEHTDYEFHNRARRLDENRNYIRRAVRFVFAANVRDELFHLSVYLFKRGGVTFLIQLDNCERFA